MRVACDAMCGGVARWLRVFGVDTTYTAGIDDGELVAHAQAEGRVLVSADGPLFERRPLASGEVRGVRLPVGLKLAEQVRFVVDALNVTPGEARCSLCNGELVAVTRGEVADVVPARSLIWVKAFFRCRDCAQVFWEGSHWRRIRAVRAALDKG
jgi:uncharacterized protein with PIN domain